MSEEPIPQDIQGKILDHCTSMGAKAKVISRKDDGSLPHLWFDMDPLPGTYWLKQEDRAQDHFLEGIWKILEVHEAQ